MRDIALEQRGEGETELAQEEQTHERGDELFEEKGKRVKQDRKQVPLLLNVRLTFTYFKS